MICSFLDRMDYEEYSPIRSFRTEIRLAGVMKLVDVPDSKSGGLLVRVGSSPTAGKLISFVIAVQDIS